MGSFTTNIFSRSLNRPSTPQINLGTWAQPFPLYHSKVVLSPRQVATHKHIIGLTGMGKSKVLESIYLQLFKQGVGVSFIDPHGKSANAILKALIAEGFFERDGWDKKLLYVEFTEDGPYLPFNILNQPRFRPHTIGEHVKTAFHRCFPALADGIASRFDNLILASINVLIDNNLPLPAVHLLLTRDDFRDRLLSNVKDPFIISFFKDRMDEWSKREAPQMKESTLSKIFSIAHQPVLRYSLGQRENVLDFRSILDSSTSVIFNLARIQDEDTKKFLGCLLTMGYEIAAKSRGDVDDPDAHIWPQHQLLLDEFQNYSATSQKAFSSFLEETRKFGMYLTLSHQTWDQAIMGIQGALQNVGVRIGLRLGPDDASYFTSVFGRIDPTRTKKEAPHDGLFMTDEQKYAMKAFLEIQAQWWEWTQALLDLPERQAMVKISGKKTVQINTAFVPMYDVTTERLMEVKRRYQSFMKSTQVTTVPDDHFGQVYPMLDQSKPLSVQAYSRAYQSSSSLE